MKYIYEFCGGRLNGMRLDSEQAFKLCNGRINKDYSKERVQGILCHRKELDNQPLFDGYLPPMWNGMEYLYEGRLITSWEYNRLSEKKKFYDVSDCYGVIRYETQKMYNMLSQ